MPAHLHREIDELKKTVLHLGAVVEENVFRAVRSIEERDARLAQKVIDVDIEIDRMEVEVEEECLKILALNQPVAIDLRFIVAMLKLDNDLERIGDLAVNIAERAVYLANNPRTDVSFEYGEMGSRVKSMLQKSLDCLVNMDADLAREVCGADDEVDDLERRIIVQAREAITKYPDQADRLLHHMFVAKHLERIADHATNIAEDVVYMVEGEIVRHGITTYGKERKPER